MFIKVIDDDQRERYINSDHVTDMFLGSEIATLYFSICNRENESYACDITLDSAAYFLSCVEAKSASVEVEIEPPSLKTRIAQALRWDYPNGALVSYLTSAISQNHEGEIEIALAELEIENVAVQHGPFWYHASNRPSASDSSFILHPSSLDSTPSPDLSDEAAEKETNLAESTENSLAPNDVD